MNENHDSNFKESLQGSGGRKASESFPHFNYSDKIFRIENEMWSGQEGLLKALKLKALKLGVWQIAV